MKPDQFLKRCESSSLEAYEAFKELLRRLENPTTRVEALQFWIAFGQQISKSNSPEELLKRYHFSIQPLELRSITGEPLLLNLLQLPSTFAPEDWSYTFFEGLTRSKVADFEDRRVVELGCGIGWITLALAMQTRPSKIIGLDINPRAIVCSKLNLFLNSFDVDGNPTWQHQGKPLNDYVEFHESDLLAYCRENQLHLDGVIGCIPQVLNPDPEFATQIEPGADIESASDEFLHALSNYTPSQGLLEDEFGLGLIARALEESTEVLRPTGKVILNLGGRPGSAVIERLFARRGFRVKPIWQTRVKQAADTDIQSLVSIESRSSHRFEFYLGPTYDQPVSAKTAQSYTQAGGEIYHGLTVYEGSMRVPDHLPKVLRYVRRNGLEQSRKNIDLSFSEDSLATEKISFLSAFIDELQATRHFPYENTQGTLAFRKSLGKFFQNYLRIPLTEDNFLISPNRTELFKNLQLLFDPESILIDSILAKRAKLNGIEIPRDADQVCALIEKIKPQVVIYSMSEAEARTADPFIRLSLTAAQTFTRLFVDVSDLIDLSSTPPTNGIFRWLANNALPHHVSLIGGLVKNRLYRDLQVGFVLTENTTLISHLVNAAQLTYSRTPVLNQLYYDRILNDLLNFQVSPYLKPRTQTLRRSTPEDGSAAKHFIGLSNPAKTAFSHSAIADEEEAALPGLIRMDYGENALASPNALHQSLFEAFSKFQLLSDESNCDDAIFDLVQKRLGITASPKSQLVYGNGEAPLFAALTNHARNASIAMLFPTGNYGHFVACAQAFGVSTNFIETHEKDFFKVTSETLEIALKKLNAPAWLVLTAPIVNPTGASYSAAELKQLLVVLKKYRSVLILDTIFQGLEFNTLPGIETTFSDQQDNRWIILGGISKEFAGGGLRFGYALTSDIEMIGALQNSAIAEPHSTLRYAFRRLLEAQLDEDPLLLKEMSRQKIELKDRATKLADVLNRNGWKVLTPQGGLFLVAKPTTILNRQYNGTLVSEENLASLLRQHGGVSINPPKWTGIPHYFRFVLSMQSEEFVEALKRLEKFYQALS